MELDRISDSISMSTGSDTGSDTDFVDALDKLDLQKIVCENGQDNESSSTMQSSLENDLPSEEKLSSVCHVSSTEQSVSTDQTADDQIPVHIATDGDIHVPPDINQLEHQHSETNNTPMRDHVDEEEMKLLEATMTPEEKEVRAVEAQAHKSEGNQRFKACNYEGALESYTDALLICPLAHTKDRSIMYSNRAATKVKLERTDGAIEDCTRALELNSVYMKALLRRAELYEQTDKPDDALTDYTKALELDPNLSHARRRCTQLPGEIEERNEKMKAEMMGKLKDLGNLVLRPFGLSTENFKMQQDPNSGSYSVQFQQNAPASNDK